MSSRVKTLSLSIVPMLLAAAQTLSAQPVQSARPPASEGTGALAKGWTALASGNAGEAERLSDSLLKTSPRHHDAIALKIAARLTGRTAPGAVSALDAYESWIAAVQREDVFLLESIAKGMLDAHAKSNDQRVRTRALELLAATGDAQAVAQLNTMAAGSEPTSVAVDDTLARLGDAAAVRRLADRVKNGGTRDVSEAIDALAEANVKSAVGVIASALDPAKALPTKMAAARALGLLGDSTAIPRLKEALNDPDPPVRVLAAAALARLGDSAGAEIVQKLENSPVGDLRLLAVEVSASSNPSGPWVGVATGVLKDPDPLVRLRAAELLLRHAADPGAARDTFREALADQNPAMRDAAGQRLQRLPTAALADSLPELRKLLRDPSALTQLEAAGGVLRLAGAIDR
jgi:HEAT repeat protein